MKLKEFIENANTATKKIELLLYVMDISNQSSLHSPNNSFSSDYQEIANCFVKIEPVIDKYGKRSIVFQNEEIDLFRETLAVFDKSRARIAELCIAELRYLCGKLSVIYNNDLEAEIDLS